MWTDGTIPLITSNIYACKYRVTGTDLAILASRAALIGAPVISPPRRCRQRAVDILNQQNRPVLHSNQQLPQLRVRPDVADVDAIHVESEVARDRGLDLPVPVGPIHCTLACGAGQSRLGFIFHVCVKKRSVD
jgi:hypothetical protein